jgi:hypothetical protein
MRLRSYLQLGRVSNLPTVWTNVLAGGVLAGGTLSGRALAGPLVAGTAFYVGGMFLNDAFDREIDRRERADRPIPSGRVGVAEVFAIGFGLLLVGWLILLVQLRRGYGSPTALLAGVALAGAIVLYNAWHKGNPLSPVLMGVCRALLYAMAGLALAVRPSPALWAGALVLLAYLVGLTYVAKQETLTELPNTWPLLFLAAPFAYAAPTLLRNPSAALLYLAFLAWVLYALRMLVRRVAIGRAVVTLIAGISLLDAVLIAGAGHPALALAAAAALLLTLALQRYVSGT